MKYCTNCGQQLNDNQQFCQNCGANVAPKKADNHHKQNVTRQTKAQTKHKKASQKKKNKLPIIIISIVALVLVILTGLAIYFLMYVNKGQVKHESNAHQIDVLSTQFSDHFMNQDNTSGYDGFELGMTSKEIENKFGKADKTIDLPIGKVYQYGNMGVYYGASGDVSSVYVIPNNVSVSAFKEVHGEPTVQTNDQMIYDDNPDNGFTIFINYKHNQITSIENTYQIDSNSMDDLKNMNTTDNESISQSFSIDADNYANGIGKMLDTAFNATDYTEQGDTLSQARKMTDSWDGLLGRLETRDLNTRESHIVDQLHHFKESRDDIFDDLDTFVNHHDAQAWHDAQDKRDQLKKDLDDFFNQS